MSNHNAAPLMDEANDEDELSPYSNTAPRSINGNFSFLMNPDSKDNKGGFKKISFTESLKIGSQEDESDEEDEEKPLKAKKSKVGRSLRKLFKKRRPQISENTTADSRMSGVGVSPRAEEFTPANNVETEPTVSEDMEVASSPDLPLETEPENSIPLETEPNPDTGPVSNNTVPTPNVAAANTPPTPNAHNTQPPVPPSNNTPPGLGGVPPYNAGGGNLANQPPVNPNLQPNNANQQPGTTIIERRGSGIGPLVAFLAANYLSKRRDKKIKRSVSKLDKQLKETQDQAQKERLRANTAERNTSSKNIEHQDAINRIERSIRASKEQESSQAPAKEALKAEKQIEPKSDAVKVSEVIASKNLSRPEQSEALRAFKVDKPEADKQDTRLHEKPVEKIDALKTETIPQPLRESVFERRHEVKEDPKMAEIDNTSFSQASGGGSTSVFGDDSATQSSLSSDHPQNAKLSTTDDAYKQSIRQGVVMGLCLIILGVIAYLLFT